MSLRWCSDLTNVLTERQQVLLHAALSYAYSNLDDLNECFALDSDPITEEELMNTVAVLVEGKSLN